MANVAGPSLMAPIADATDIVDAVDAVDIVDNNTSNKDKKKKKDDADFDAFGSARTLQGETVADAQAAAAAEEEKRRTNSKCVDEGEESSSSLTAINEITRTTTTPPELVMEKERDKEDIIVNGDDETAKKESTTSTANNNSRFVSPKDFELLKVIGMGAFGKVLQVKNKTSGQVLAMKVMSKRILKRKAGYIENIQAERNILTRVNHPFVVKMHCSFQTKEKLFIIMDFLAGGELFLRLGREGIFLEKDAAFYLAEIILGVDHLHSLGILHRDLKPENILLCNDGHICLTDFGLAKDFGPDWNFNTEGGDGTGEGDRARTICGTQEYMAPGKEKEKENS